MAWLQKYPSGTYHINFRFGGCKFKRSLKTKSKSEAQLRLQRLEETVRLVEGGWLEIPELGEVTDFLLSDGRLASKPKVTKSLSLTELFDRYYASLPNGALENNTLKNIKIHQRHLERRLGKRFSVVKITRDILQNYINRRSQDPGRRRRKVSTVTIKKALSTLRCVWNWARAGDLVKFDFPNKGLQYPKIQEKPRFQTWDEIVSRCESGNLSDQEVADLWDNLFLQRHEIDELLEYVRLNAAHPFIYPMVFTAAHTGARRSELVRSELTDIDQTHLTIREKKRVKGKNSTRRVPISPHLHTVLCEWKVNQQGRPSRKRLVSCSANCELGRRRVTKTDVTVL